MKNEKRKMNVKTPGGMLVGFLVVLETEHVCELFEFPGRNRPYALICTFVREGYQKAIETHLSRIFMCTTLANSVRNQCSVMSESSMS